jgi:hypothetical protein
MVIPIKLFGSSKGCDRRYAVRRDRGKDENNWRSLEILEVECKLASTMRWSTSVRRWNFSIAWFLECAIYRYAYVERGQTGGVRKHKVYEVKAGG